MQIQESNPERKEQHQIIIIKTLNWKWLKALKGYKGRNEENICNKQNS